MELTKDELSNAVATLIKYLREDKDYFRGWKDNIAMAFQDQYNRTESLNSGTPGMLAHLNIHEIANRAAENFLNLLTNVPKDDGEILYP